MTPGGPSGLDWFGEKSADFRGEILRDEPLARHTYYRIGGPAKLMLVPKSVEDLFWIHRGLKDSGVSFAVLGVGSNTLASDDGFKGVVIKLSKLDQSIEDLGESEGVRRIRCGASVAISTLLKRASTGGWGSFDLWTGIPGSVGGAVAMNAGTHLGETADILESVQIFDLKSGALTELSRKQIDFSYRVCKQVTSSTLVVSAVFKTRVEDPAKTLERIQATLARRKATQPIDKPSCGSVFKNPKEAGLHAWQVIEKVGLRGYQEGQAQFSDKHCNFIVNLGGAKAWQVRALIDEAKKRAHEKLGIELHEEVRSLGFK
ncbi:MAG: UDP-N-acetylmuramate dehydrogenase [Bdellovibrionales bacterium]|nr:UDP-N-acetylmuramate dehydrogenase [Bdellovibrionales bacterium]